MTSYKRVAVWLGLAGLFLAPLAAQEPLLIDETCTATVGNQTAVVRGDGTFEIPNIYAFQFRDTGLIPELFRLRVTCVRGGEMITGQSDFFEMQPGQTTFVQAVYPTELDPIPASLSMTSPQTNLRTGQGGAQLEVLGAMPEGSVRDLTRRSTGTTYFVSNPALLHVSPDGLVSSISQQELADVMVIALNQGNVVSIEFTAVRGDVDDDDLDGDGMPNGYEELYGFNPLIRDDYLDADGDGLTNRQEYQRGTVPTAADTDLDGMNDSIDPFPLTPDETPPMVSFQRDPSRPYLIAGETLELRSTAVEQGGYLDLHEILVNGVPLVQDTFAFVSFPFTVPLGSDVLTLTSRAQDRVGQTTVVEESLAVTSDPGAGVVGEVVDPQGSGVALAATELLLGGLTAEFYDLDGHTTTFPDWDARPPDAVRRLSSLNFLNPDFAFTDDTFALGFGDDWAARIRGTWNVGAPDRYRLGVGSEGRVFLRLDGQFVTSFSGNGTFREVDFLRVVPAGPQSFELFYLHHQGPAELRFRILENFRDFTVPSGHDFSLFRTPDPSITATDDGGFFRLDDQPSILGPVQARAVADVGGEVLVGRSRPADVAPGSLRDAGSVNLRPNLDILIYDEPCKVSSTRYDISISAYGEALRRLGYETFTVVTSEAELATRLAAQSWDLVIVDNARTVLGASIAGLVQHVENGGRTVMSYWGWEQHAGLDEVFDARWTDVVRASDGDRHLYGWALDHPLWTQPNELPQNPNQVLYTGATWDFGCTFWGGRFEPLAGAQAVAGYQRAGDPFAEAAWIVGNEGRTVLVGGLLGFFVRDQIVLDGRADAYEMAENVVRFLLRDFDGDPMP